MAGREYLFFLSSFLAKIADQALLFIVPLVIFQSTGSVSWAGAAFFIEALPRFIAFPVCGILCDRIPPLRLLHVSQVLRGVVCAVGVGGEALTGGVGWLIALSAMCGVMTTQGVMAREVILPRISSRHSFKQILSYTQIADQLGTILGPVMASLLFAVLPWEHVVLCLAFFFLLADGAITIWHRTALLKDTPPSRIQAWSTSFKTALSYIWYRPGLKDLVVLAASLNLVIGVTLATSAAMVTGLHGQSEFSYAVLQVAGAVATVVILMFVAHTSAPLALMGGASYTLIFVGGMLMALSKVPWLYILGYVVVIGFDKMFNVYIRNARQQIIPQEDYGKTTGVIIAINNLSQPLAGLLVSVFASSLDSAPTVIMACVLVMGVLGIAVGQRRYVALRHGGLQKARMGDDTAV